MHRQARGCLPERAPCSIGMMCRAKTCNAGSPCSQMSRKTCMSRGSTDDRRTLCAVTNGSPGRQAMRQSTLAGAHEASTCKQSSRRSRVGACVHVLRMHAALGGKAISAECLKSLPPGRELLLLAVNVLCHQGRLGRAAMMQRRGISAALKAQAGFSAQWRSATDHERASLMHARVLAAGSAVYPCTGVI